MEAMEVSKMVRKLYFAFLSRDRQTAEELLSEDFTFSSPRDPHLDRDGYFETCFPNSDQFRFQQIENLFVQGNQVFVRYLVELKDGSKFRNTEFIRIAGDKIKSVEVYFGTPVKD